MDKSDNVTTRILMIGACLKQNGGIATVENLIIKYAPSNIIIKHISSHKEGSIVYRLTTFVNSLVTYLFQLFFYKVDLVLVQLSDGGSIIRKAIIAIIGITFGKPVIIHAHGAEFDKTYSRLPRGIQKGLNKVFSRCTAFIVLSASWKNFYVEKCNLRLDKVFIINNPIEIPVFTPQRADKQGELTLFFCGRIGERKGAFDLIRAFASLPDEQKHCSQLIMAGDGDITEAKQLVESLSLSQKVTFPGWIDSERREKLLAGADLFVLPSYHEGLPMAILEAMSWGLPIVSTEVGGIPEIIVNNHNGILIQPGDIERLTEVIQLLISAKSLRFSLGKNARNSVISLDVSNYWNQLFTVFNICRDN